MTSQWSLHIHLSRNKFLRILLVTVGCVGLSLVIPMTTSTAGALPCRYDPSTHKLRITADEFKRFRIRRVDTSIRVSSPGGNIHQTCDEATVNNTDRIIFVDRTSDGEGLFAINLDQGPFEPGNTPENEGQSEIEFSIDTRGPDENPTDVDLWIYGTGSSDSLTGGSQRVMMNGDDDADLGGPGRLEHYGVSAEAGDDSVFLDGRRGTGRFANGDLGAQINGGRDHDLLIGGSGRDFINSGEGADRVFGRGSRDVIQGWMGPDHMIGGRGHDLIFGDFGGDHLEGSRGNDRLLGEKGGDHLDGDAGEDDCRGGPGTDTLEDCEP